MEFSKYSNNGGRIAMLVFVKGWHVTCYLIIQENTVEKRGKGEKGQLLFVDGQNKILQ